MKHQKQNFNQLWLDERISEIKTAKLSDTDRTVILAETIVLYLEKKISHTVFLVIMNLIMILAPEPISPEIKKIENQIRKLKMYHKKQPDEKKTLYNFTMILEDLVQTLKKHLLQEMKKNNF